MNLSQRRPITDEEAVEMLSCMDQAECKGMFDNLFCGDQVVLEVLASQEQLLQSINHDMKLTKGFFRRIYGYELSFPGFREQAISVLEAAGCAMARVYYDDIIGEYQTTTEAILRPVAASYLKECNQKWEQRQKRGELKRDLQEMDNRRLLTLLKNLAAGE